MTQFAHDKVVPYENSKLKKKEQVAEMFNSIAFRYDFLNRFLTAGIDVRWRKKAILLLKGIQPQTILDVATGTGDVALLTYELLHPKKIIGIDISEGMLQLGRQKVAKAGLEGVIELRSGDSEIINYPNDTFDAITVAFGVRNFENLERGLAEMLRVLRPGGKLVVLEFSRPKNIIFRAMCNFYEHIIVPAAGKLFSGNKNAYAYLNRSAKVFPERKDFTDILQRTGYKNTYYKPLSLGICCMYCADK
ncbi:bifunctional demethylmenaquinone methyltransferase/2-methoxy-6-polyprenyl-1,4-benzoquinol methylase UbiE [Ilyomonas limi]|uniref:Demethylmenaquinone methyltransferase n=1 Tax=Ilyomonas limi TaxID=2575867 RepID=A0A4U3L4P7_9BACT|nr:bifunctional demethylmenaquinone methyltransferase/2-methoxy-6-polyprenyl-1,4-benzoquinol methylase UbiE [Ilyomonas limi]TKK69304.1 bifunctional demethylmenaquinone methyltransferase/2-methoxy-6-polyprenyl-1,4-benzoquinol methylase UbiE [Ilyomonas limi]